MDVLFNHLIAIPIPIIEKIIRPIIIYLFLIIGLRLAGKREMAQLNPFDLVVLLTISNTVQNAIIGSDNSVSGEIIGAATLLILNYFVVRFIHHNKHLEKILVGSEVQLITDGKMMTDVMEKEGIDLAELEVAAHRQGLDSLDDIDKAILEPEGAISFKVKQSAIADRHQQELLDRIAILEAKLDAISAKV